MKSNCDYCVNYSYDEEYECYTCEVNLDEDEMAHFIAGNYHQCPYFRMGDEYKIVRKQMQASFSAVCKGLWKELQKMPDGKGGIQFKTDLRIVQVIGEFLTKGADPFVYRVAVTVQVCSRSLNRTIAKQIFLQGDEIAALVFFS